jgi:hypothetical protein
MDLWNELMNERMCVCVCVYACVYVWMHVCMHAGRYIGTYVCMYQLLTSDHDLHVCHAMKSGLITSSEFKIFSHFRYLL